MSSKIVMICDYCEKEGYAANLNHLPADWIALEEYRDPSDPAFSEEADYCSRACAIKALENPKP